MHQATSQLPAEAGLSGVADVVLSTSASLEVARALAARPSNNGTPPLEFESVSATSLGTLVHSGPYSRSYFRVPFTAVAAGDTSDVSSFSTPGQAPRSSTEGTRHVRGRDLRRRIANPGGELRRR